MNDWIPHGQWLGNTGVAWIAAGAGALLGYAFLHAFAAILGARLRQLGERTHRAGFTVAADAVKATRGWLLLLITIAVALDFLRFEGSTRYWLQLASYALMGTQVALWACALLASWLHRVTSRDRVKPANPVMVGVLTWALQLVVWITLILALMAKGGANISAFVASLGVGGVAVALALQNVLGDMFASISIGLDKPFEVGEFIAFGDDEGTVTKVGIKSTRIRSLSGEELSISNSWLLKLPIHNYSRRKERRVVCGFKLPIGFPHAQLPAMIEAARAAVTAEPQARFEHCFLAGIGETSLDLELAYRMPDAGGDAAIGTRHRVNLRLLQARASMVQARDA